MSSNREIIKEKIRELVVEALTEGLTPYTDVQKPETVGEVVLQDEVRVLQFIRMQYDGALKMLTAPEFRNDVPPTYTLVGQLSCLMSSLRAERTEVTKLKGALEESRTHVGELEAALQTSRELCDSLRGGLGLT